MNLLGFEDIDQWVNGKFCLPQSNGDEIQPEATEIIQIPCPRCKTIIRRSNRYISLLNRRMMEIQEVSNIISKYLRKNSRKYRSVNILKIKLFYTKKLDISQNFMDLRIFFWIIFWKLLDTTRYAKNETQIKQ